MSNMLFRRPVRRLAPLAAAICTITPLVASAQSWVATAPANWFSANWSPATIPDAPAADATVAASGQVTLSQNVSLRTLLLSSPGSISQDSGTATLTGTLTETSGYYALNAGKLSTSSTLLSGTFEQFAGLHTTSALSLSSTSAPNTIYNIRGGTTSATAVTLGSSPAATMLNIGNTGGLPGSTGTLSTTTLLINDSTATLRLGSGGTLTASSISVAAGTLRQSGGSLSTSSLSIAPNATYIISNGSLSAPVTNSGTFTTQLGLTLSSSFKQLAGIFSGSPVVGSAATFTFSGGILQGSLSNYGTLLLSTGSMTGSLATYGPATLSSGTFSVTGATTLGSNTNRGSLTLASGLLITPSISLASGSDLILAGGSTQNTSLTLAAGSTVTASAPTTPFTTITMTGGTASGPLTSASTFSYSAGTTSNLSLTANALSLTADLSIASLTVPQLNLAAGRAVTVSGALQNLTSAGTFSQTGGTLAAGSFLNNGLLIRSSGTGSLGTITGTGSLLVSPNATLTASYLRQKSLALSGTVSLTGSAPSELSSFLVTTNPDGSPAGYLNLGTSPLLLHGTSEATVTALIKSWYHAGARDGAGLGSSAAPANSILTLAVMTNDNYLGKPAFTTFAGLPSSYGDTVVKLTYLGDLDLSGSVDATDYNALVLGLADPSLTGWRNGDINYDGAINLTDLALFQQGLTHQGAPLGSALATPPSSVSVPEPSVLALGLLALPLLTRRRRLGLSLLC